MPRLGEIGANVRENDVALRRSIQSVQAVENVSSSQAQTLPSSTGGTTFGTRATLKPGSAKESDEFQETDTGWRFRFHNAQWVFTGGNIFAAVTGARPTVTTRDNGALFFDVATGALQQVQGGAWQTVLSFAGTTNQINTVFASGVLTLSLPGVAGWGTPTGNAASPSFAAGTATLSQTAAALAQLILDLKTAGVLKT